MEGLILAQQIAIWTLPVLFAITVHEVAHGWMAGKLGDPTAKMLGRLTLNPVRHIDPIGTIAVPLVLLFMTAGSMVFGWARPVPVTYENLKRPRRDMALVAAAGPIANLIMAVLWAVLWKLGFVLQGVDVWFAALIEMSKFGVMFNLLLMLINLLPILPLDGGRILSSVLPSRLSWQYGRLEPYGLIFLVVLLLTGAMSILILPVLSHLEMLIYNLFGL